MTAKHPVGVSSVALPAVDGYPVAQRNKPAPNQETLVLRQAGSVCWARQRLRYRPGCFIHMKPNQPPGGKRSPLAD
ncbi:MAG TPA: hypothetical protein DD666_00030 [Advenella kashmirensis]|uniref:Uncharacterized protein n=1 Tax=Advenella kashmirensis TaxID=310575 RepID=A0A356LAK9_9BURK|nr:hypothetical protein [Advenella kashmirensis]